MHCTIIVQTFVQGIFILKYTLAYNKLLDFLKITAIFTLHKNLQIPNEIDQIFFLFES
jgi:hypothetical protein